MIHLYYFTVSWGVKKLVDVPTSSGRSITEQLSERRGFVARVQMKGARLSPNEKDNLDPFPGASAGA